MCQDCPTQLTEELVTDYELAIGSFASDQVLVEFLSKHLGMFSVNNIAPRILRQKPRRSPIPHGVVARVLYAHGHAQLAELCDMAETILLIKDEGSSQNPCDEIPLSWDGKAGRRSST